ncbi:MAG: single-stranded-DNA-specific exonuclease RecJ [Legionellales bacterium]|nr:single-stranded-DNA-specific exonuclease RecJ [Legionellales bacterium]
MTPEIVKRKIRQTHQLTQNLHPILNRIYLARGVYDAAELDKRAEHLLPYTTLSGLNEAMSCLYDALSAQQCIVVVGDFDADGATSSALAVLALKTMGIKNIHYLVPNRFEYGYGLTPELVEVAKKFKPELLITVDNGITCFSGVEAAKKAGIKVIVTDHHLPGSTLPAADAIVNPNLSGDAFQSKNLAGVGVIFYVMLAFRAYLREKNWFVSQSIQEPNMIQFLDLVALGTVADVVPLDRNNRILVHLGLQRIRSGRARFGIKALLSVAGRNEERITAADLAFAVAPRLNAAGRLNDMSVGIAGLLAENFDTALQIATQLNELNDERRTIETDMQEQANEQLKQLSWHQIESCPSGICLFNQHWHQGVIGILASRIKDKLHRPVVAFALANEHELKGSARSIAGLHIRDIFQAIDAKQPGLITKFGGHAMAAGLQLPKNHLTRFSEAFAEEVTQHLTPNSLQRIIYSDGELSEAEATLDLAQILRDAEPWGQAFPEPLFEGVFLLLEQRIVGGRHLKMKVCWQSGQKTFDAIAFNVDLNDWPNHRCEQVNLVYKLDINEFNGRRSVQLMVEHITPC